MQRIFFVLVAVSFAYISCTKDKTAYEAGGDTGTTEQYGFKEAFVKDTAGYSIRVETVNGAFRKGYGALRLAITHSETGQLVIPSSVTFLPVKTDIDGNTVSCPHRYDFIYQPDEQYFSGYSVFTGERNADESWKLYIGFTIEGQTYKVVQPIRVEQQTNPNLGITMFTGKDKEEYVLALIAPQQPKVGENKLVAGIYKSNKPTQASSGTFPDPSQFSYTEVNGYTLLLDPRMPEPSMGNHSSPNNVDLTQQDDGLYYGVVNYTMTGNWTLNFIMLNPDGEILRGTKVPAAFTPGVEGEKSELFLDILF